MDIHNRVKTARLMAGLSTEQLAERLKIARVNVVRWESTRILSRNQLQNVAAACGINAGFLEGGPLEGLVIARPAHHIALNTRQRAFDYLEQVLPELTRDTRSVEVSSYAGSIWLYHSKAFCLAMIPNGEMRFEQKNHHDHINTGEKQIKEAYASDQAMVEILKAAGLSDLYLPRDAAQLVATLNIVIGCAGVKDVMSKLAEAVDGLRSSGHDVILKTTS